MNLVLYLAFIVVYLYITYAYTYIYGVNIKLYIKEINCKRQILESSRKKASLNTAELVTSEGRFHSSLSRCKLFHLRRSLTVNCRKLNVWNQTDRWDNNTKTKDALINLRQSYHTRYFEIVEQSVELFLVQRCLTAMELTRVKLVI